MNPEAIWAIVGEGQAYSRVKHGRSLLLRLGRKRFGPPMPEAADDVEAIEDVDRLDALLLRALDVSSWADLLGSPWIAHIGLGSNLGDRRANLDGALAALAGARGVEVRAVSRYYETAPVGGPAGQGPFLNAAASLSTTLGSLDLLRLLQNVERQARRVREVRWGARTLDVDLLMYGDTIMDTPELTLPHPRMAVRRFVLGPLAEADPGAVDPSTGLSVAALLANLDRRPGVVLLSGLGCLEAAVREAIGPAPADWVVQAVADPAHPPTFEARRGRWADRGRPGHPTLYLDAEGPEAIAADIHAAMLAAHPGT